MSEPPKPPAEGALEKKAHEYLMPVFIGDTDAYAMMYHTNYLKHFERARLCLLGVAAIAQLQRDDSVTLVELSSKHIRYFDSARLGEDCVVLSTLMEVGECYASINHVCRRVSDSKDLNRMIAKVGLVDSNREPVPWPAALRSALENLAPYSGPRMVCECIPFEGA
jgi:acyl-CoA thioesterase FadM